MPERKKGISFAPRKRGSSLRDWVSYKGNKNETKVFILFHKKACKIRKWVVLLHPLRETHCVRKSEKQEWHVHRHIELTAVLSQDKTKKKRVR